MRYTEKMDCALIAMECRKLFEEMGYLRVTVFVDADHGEAKIKIFGGRIPIWNNKHWDVD